MNTKYKSKDEIKKDINKAIGIMNDNVILIANLSDDINPIEDAMIELIKAYETYEQARVHLIKAKRMLEH